MILRTSIALIIAIWVIAMICLPAANAQAQLACQGEVQAGEMTLSVEIAANDATRARGMMFRSKMADDAGMLFLFGREEPRSFWMKNTFLPLDILFYNDEGQLTGVRENAVPQDLSPLAGFGSAVLEINAGQYAKNAKAYQEISLNLNDQSACSKDQWRLISVHPIGQSAK